MSNIINFLLWVHEQLVNDFPVYPNMDGVDAFDQAVLRELWRRISADDTSGNPDLKEYVAAYRELKRTGQLGH